MSDMPLASQSGNTRPAAWTALPANTIAFATLPFQVPALGNMVLLLTKPFGQ